MSDTRLHHLSGPRIGERARLSRDQRFVRGIARALLVGRVDFRPAQSLTAFVTCRLVLPGMGERNVHYMAMRATSPPDAFPAADLIVRHAANPGAPDLTTRSLSRLAGAWRPWSARAVVQLWRSSLLASTPPLPLPAHWPRR